MRTDSSLHMIRLRASLPPLMRLLAARGLPLDRVDIGYAGHVLLTEVFGTDGIRQFTFRGQDADGYSILAYSDKTEDELRLHADAFATPEAHACVQWDQLSSKPLPSVWPEGLQMRFELRACPVVRSASDTEHYRRGAEVDAFLARCVREGGDAVVDRFQVYEEWLADQLERRGETTLSSVRVKRFELANLFRRSQNGQRTGRAFQRPAVDFEGTLTSGPAAPFAELVRRGVGRHGGFGFGMLLLRPA